MCLNCHLQVHVQLQLQYALMLHALAAYRYEGFLIVNTPENGRPGQREILYAAEMLRKKNAKTTQSLNPLYARRIKGVLVLAVRLRP